MQNHKLTMNNNVVLVDEKDNVVGELEKLEAHIKGQLHRAFSVFIFNDKKELLLQQRADTKYHGGGLWTNTCCSHPQINEDVLESAKKRLKFEIGMMCELHWQYSFIYKENVENNLIENELDHVFIGFSNAQPIINSDEVKNYKWLSIKEVLKDIENIPTNYTVWFKQALPELISKIEL